MPSHQKSQSQRPATATPTATTIETTTSSELSIDLACRTPFDWSGLIEFLRPRAIPGVESITGKTYARAVAAGRSRGIVTVEWHGEGKLVVRMPRSFAAFQSKVAACVAHLFDAAADPEAITAVLSRDRVMGLVARAHPGVRVPGCWDPFELAVRAIVGQQVSVAGASTLIGRIAAAFGTPVKRKHSEGGPADSRSHPPSIIFPTADRLAGASLAGLGFTTKRASTILGLARAVTDHQIVLERGPSLDESIRSLTALPGIGPWTAHYIAMRAYHETDAFPSTDLWLRRGMGYGARFLERLAEDWRPYRAYAAMLIWRTV